MKTVGRLGRVVLSGYFGLLLLFLYVPLAMLVVLSFNNSTIETLPLVGFTTKWYTLAFSNAQLIAALRRSAEIAALNGLCATFLAMIAALGLSARRLMLGSAILGMLLLPLVVPYIVLAVGMLILLHQLGLSTSLLAVLAGHVVISLPYAILVLLPRLRSLDRAMTEAARDLGAGAVGSVWLVTLPLMAPALMSSFLIAFTISFDEFAIASFLAPSGSPTYPLFLYAGVRTPELEPQVIAIGAIVIAASMAVVVLSEVGRRWGERRLEGFAERQAPTVSEAVGVSQADGS